MGYLVLRKKSTLLILVFSIIGLSTVFSPRVHASYRSDYLIRDSLFIASDSMSGSNIQAFLVNKNSYLASHSYKENCSNNYMHDHYANCGKTVLAATIINDAAKAYNLSPKVILATMQKEQSLITDPSPSSSQVNFAMGYGCPDSGGCGSVSGFFNQVDWGAWQLRLNFARANGDTTWLGTDSYVGYACPNATRYYSTGLYPGRNVTFYDDHSTAYTHFIIANGATASLYCYTPHAYPGSNQQYYSGSYWFVYYFERWFGPVRYQGPDVPLLGDWDGDGNATVGIKRGDEFLLDNNNDGVADVTFTYGNDKDIPLVGDWDGDGHDTISLKRGNTYYINNSLASGSELQFDFGNPNTPAFGGDWDGDGSDTISLRMGNTYYINNSLSPGSDSKFNYGTSNTVALAGDWDGDGHDTISAKIGNYYYINNSLASGSDFKFTYGDNSDKPLGGDWDDNGNDSVSLNRGKVFYINNQLAPGSDAKIVFVN